MVQLPVSTAGQSPNPAALIHSSRRFAGDSKWRGQISCCSIGQAVGYGGCACSGGSLRPIGRCGRPGTPAALELYRQGLRRDTFGVSMRGAGCCPAFAKGKQHRVSSPRGQAAQVWAGGPNAALGQGFRCTGKGFAPVAGVVPWGKRFFLHLLQFHHQAAKIAGAQDASLSPRSTQLSWRISRTSSPPSA